jgi:predicted ester cyclase
MSDITFVAQKWVDVFNKKEVDLWDEIVHPDAINYAPLMGPTPGIEGFKERGRWIIDGFPTCVSKVADVFSEGEKLVFRWTLEGTQDGPFMGLDPTGKFVHMEGINIEYVRNGKVAEHWSFPNLLEVMKQLQG